MDDRTIASWRLRNQALTGTRHPDAGAAVRGLLAVQAENPDQSAWAVAARTVTPQRDDLASRLDSGDIIRTHVLRPTWHYVAAEDLVWLVEVTAPRIRPTHIRHLASLDIDVPAMTDVVLAALATAERTRPELAAMLAEAGHPLEGMSLMLFLADLELQALVCSGRCGDQVHRYALVEARVPSPRRLERDEALAELALRYVRSHGPVTERDLAYWATLTLTDVRRGLAANAYALASFEHDGRRFWHAADSEPPTGTGEPRAFMLQLLDEMYRGYQDSRWVLDVAGVVPRERESAIGMALVDAQLVAAMKRTVTASAVRFDLLPYPSWTRGCGPLVDEAAARYGAFLGLPAMVRLAE